MFNVVRVISQVNVEWAFSVLWWSSITLELLQLTHLTPHTKHGGRFKLGGVGTWVKLYPCMLFKVFLELLECSHSSP